MEPNRAKFMDTLNAAINNFVDGKFTNVIAISHNDADGISSLHLVQNLLYKRKIDYDYFIYNRSSSWSSYLNGIFSRKNTDKSAFIFTDVGSNLEELIPIIQNRNEHFFILDHHEVDTDVNQVEFPENLHFVNPTLFGYDGLDHIAGATLTYLFTREINPSLIKQGWLTVIGIAGDSLKSMDKLQSFNREVYEEILFEEVFEDREGLTLFGSMHQSIKNGLKFSILPFVKGYGGEDNKKIRGFLESLNIDPDKKIIDLNENERNEIIANTSIEGPGHYAIMPQKTGMLQYAFEHALLLNILCFKNISAAISMIRQKKITRYAKGIYKEYISNLVKNLHTLISLPRLESEKAIFINAAGKIPPSNWSDTASFASVNEILDPYKILFLGGEEKKNHMMKLSIRCTRKYLAENNGIGVNSVILKIKKDLGGMGGGHKLAGGIRMSIPSFKRLKDNFDDYINL